MWICFTISNLYERWLTIPPRHSVRYAGVNRAVIHLKHLEEHSKSGRYSSGGRDRYTIRAKTSKQGQADTKMKRSQDILLKEVAQIRINDTIFRASGE